MKTFYQLFQELQSMNLQKVPDLVGRSTHDIAQYRDPNDNRYFAKFSENELNLKAVLALKLARHKFRVTVSGNKLDL